MTLHYSFDGIVCECLESPGTHINNGWFEPHYYRAVCDDVEFDYEVDVSYDDIFDYLKPHDFEKWSEELKKAYIRGFDALWDNDLVDNEMLSESLENDDYFIEFMKERYEDEAREECEKENS